MAADTWLVRCRYRIEASEQWEQQDRKSKPSCLFKFWSVTTIFVSVADVLTLNSVSKSSTLEVYSGALSEHRPL